MTLILLEDHMMIECPRSDLYRRRKNSEPPILPTRPLQPDYYHYYLHSDGRDWLEGMHYEVIEENTHPGWIGRVFLEFHDVKDAIMFKLVWAQTC